jgi:branched-chain amino acid transport system permease protein
VIEVFIAGVEGGLAYSLIGLSLVLIFRTAGVLNFAQGTLAGFAGFLAYWWTVDVGLPWLVGAAAAVLCLAAFAVGMERVAVRPLLGSGFFPIVLVTIAVDAAAANVIERVFGTSALPFSAPISGTAFEISGMRISKWTVVIAVTAVLVLAAVNFIVNRTKVGMAMRAFADDPIAARLMGISHAAVSRTTWALSVSVGAIIGIVLAPVLFLEPGYMNATFIFGLTAATVGGFSSMNGAVAGGLLLGQVQSFSIRYAPQTATAALPMLLILVVLLLRPNGLFARHAPVVRA